MKRIIISISLILVFISCSRKDVSYTQDAVLGQWQEQQFNTVIEIKKNKEGKYYGTIVEIDTTSGQEMLTTDMFNPDLSLRDRPIIGLDFITGFSYDKRKAEWRKGKIYDPSSGKDYDCKMWFEDNDTIALHLKGYLISAKLGREEIWYRLD